MLDQVVRRDPIDAAGSRWQVTTQAKRREMLGVALRRADAHPTGAALGGDPLELSEKRAPDPLASKPMIDSDAFQTDAHADAAVARASPADRGRASCPAPGFTLRTSSAYEPISKGHYGSESWKHL
jgi:hypothetical protein